VLIIFVAIYAKDNTILKVFCLEILEKKPLQFKLTGLHIQPISTLVLFFLLQFFLEEQEIMVSEMTKIIISFDLIILCVNL